MPTQVEARQLHKAQLRLAIQLGVNDLAAGRAAEINSAQDLAAMLDGCLENIIQRLACKKAVSRELS